jgi:hypothetical protein
VNGDRQHMASIPAAVFSIAQTVGIGANPNFPGNECLLGRLDDFAFYAKALSSEEIARIYATGRP